MKSRGRRDGGASAVEMAIVLPILVLLVFGIIDFGRLLTAEIQISQAAREGVRMAALGAATTDITSRALQAAPFPGLNANAAVVPVGSITTCATNSPVGATATVQVQYVFQGILLPGARTITQGAVQRCAS